MKHVKYKAMGENTSACGLDTRPLGYKGYHPNLELIDVAEVQDMLDRDRMSFRLTEEKEAKQYFKGKICLNCIRCLCSWGYLYR